MVGPLGQGAFFSKVASGESALNPKLSKPLAEEDLRPTCMSTSVEPGKESIVDACASQRRQKEVP